MAVSLSLQDVMNEGDVVAISQWDFSVTELVLQAVVEEAEQELVGQTGGAVYLLVILHCCSHTHDNTEYLCFFFLYFRMDVHYSHCYRWNLGVQYLY